MHCVCSPDICKDLCYTYGRGYTTLAFLVNALLDVGQTQVLMQENTPENEDLEMVALEIALGHSHEPLCVFQDYRYHWNENVVILTKF